MKFFCSNSYKSVFDRLSAILVQLPGSNYSILNNTRNMNFQLYHAWAPTTLVSHCVCLVWFLSSCPKYHFGIFPTLGGYKAIHHLSTFEDFKYIFSGMITNMMWYLIFIGHTIQGINIKNVLMILTYFYQMAYFLQGETFRI